VASSNLLRTDSRLRRKVAPAVPGKVKRPSRYHCLSTECCSSFSATLNTSGRGCSITITFNPSYEGRHEDTLELNFQDVVRNEQFSITRRLRAVVGSRSDQQMLKPKAPFVKRKFVPLPLEGTIISPLRPPTWSETKWVTFLSEYKAPIELINAAYPPHGRKVDTRSLVPPVLNENTYGRRFQNLLWIEEEQRR
jgi:helicase MOV-10